VPVSGIVRDPAGRPVAGALVTATSLDRPPRPVPELAVFTDPAGRYDWPSLAPGRYEMRVTTTAGTGTAAATVTPAATATANLRLRAVTGPSPPVMPEPPAGSAGPATAPPPAWPPRPGN
jgi:hypothetical protein